jgi:hypothetical protein
MPTGKAHLCVKAIVNLDNLSKDVYPLAQVGKLPHVTNTMEERLPLGLGAIAGDLIDPAFA